MNLRMVGCTHRATGVDVRQQLAFSDNQAPDALQQWRARFPNAELVLVSTCNRVELYAGGFAPGSVPTSDDLVDALLSYHHVPAERVHGQVVTLAQREAVAHLYRVAASLDSMVVGEPQILAQVKQAYQRASDLGSAGPVMHELFQSALHAARRVHHETDLHKHRVSIPSVAIADFASRVFERFDDKHVLVIGAGKMADETLRYLQDAGAGRIHVVNRNHERAQQLAESCGGKAVPWSDLWKQLVAADLVVSTTAAGEPVVTAAAFDEHVAPQRQQRPLFILDLAVPRDFEPAVGQRLAVYLYSLDDLSTACELNRQSRARELPAAEHIVTSETDAFMANAHRRAAAPVISGLRRGMEEPKLAELERLFHKLPELDERARAEITRFADRLVNKLLHPPLESLRSEAEKGPPHGLLDALKRLFQLKD
jgi:glutamyl-tRNA reductase